MSSRGNNDIEEDLTRSLKPMNELDKLVRVIKGTFFWVWKCNCDISSRKNDESEEDLVGSQKPLNLLDKWVRFVKDKVFRV